MKAARFHKVGKPLIVEDVPIPRPQLGEVLLKVKACGLCGSDIHIAIDGQTPTAFQPITLGHEISGEIAALGKGTREWRMGDRVAVSCLVSCGRCADCRTGNEQLCFRRRLLGVHLNGGLAEFVTVPARNLVKLPDGIPFEEGAILTDAVATPYRAITHRGRLIPGECVAVIGCGGLGVHAVQLARIFGAGFIVAVDVTDVALERAKAMGADMVCRADQVDPAAFIKRASGGGADLALECVGRNKTIAAAVSCLKRGGRAVVVGLGAEEIHAMTPTDLVWREIQLMGSFAFTVKEIEAVVRLVENRRLDLSASVSRTIALEAINEGLDALWRRVDDPIRIVVAM